MQNWKLIFSAAVCLAALAFHGAEAKAGSLKDIPEPLPGYSWTGFYIGGHVGYGDGDADITFATQDDEGDRWDLSHSMDGWLGGVQAGYDLQYGAFVFGLVLDWSSANIDGRRRNPQDSSNYVGAGSAVDGPPAELMTELKNIVSLRSRTGYLFEDYILFYIHAGIAFGQFDLTGQGGPAEHLSPQEDWRRGYVGGVGVEVLVFDSVTVFAEYSHFTFDESDLFILVDGSSFAGDVNSQGRDLDAVKVGANVRF